MKANVIESIKSAGIRAAIFLTAVTWAMGAMAQPSLHNRTPMSNAQSCDSVDWNPDLTTQFPWIKEGCQEVILVNGVKWARFNADFVRRNRDGTVVLDFKNSDNKSMGEVTVEPGPRQRAMIEGESYRFADLVRGQNLHLYVPEHLYAVATTPGTPSQEFEKIVAPEKAEVAAVETAPASSATQLPRTAGPLPFVLLAGLVSLLSGLGLTFRRKFRE